MLLLLFRIGCGKAVSCSIPLKPGQSRLKKRDAPTPKGSRFSASPVGGAGPPPQLLESRLSFRFNRLRVHPRTPTAPRRPYPGRADLARRTPRSRNPDRQSGWTVFRDLLVASALFAMVTLAVTYPLALHPASLGRFDNGDARLNAWAMSWVAHQVVRDPIHLFEANTFYPLPRTLAFSEHLFVPGLMTLPPLLLTNDLVLSYNLVLLFSIFLSALGMYLLTFSLTGSRLAGILAGIFFSFAPFRFNRLPHLQMQLYAFLPLALLCLHRFLETGKRVWAWGCAAFFVLQVLSGTYLAAMAAVALLVAALILTPGSGRSRKELQSLVLAFGVSALCIYPFARPYLWVNSHLGIEWDLAGIGTMSATPQSYLASSSRLYRAFTDDLIEETESRDFLFPGLTLPVLGLVGWIVLLTGQGANARPRATALCYLAIASAGFLLSLGPHTPLYGFLHEHLIFFRGLRALSRFALLPLLGLSLLAGHAVGWLFGDRGWLHDRRWVASLIGLFFLAESTALPYPFEPFRDDPPEVYAWLAEEAEPGPMVELPFLVLDTRYMFWARHHGFRATLNGDSGFVPPSHRWLKNLFLRFPSPDSIATLQRLGVRYVVLHLGAYRDQALIRLLNGLESHRAELLKIRDFGRDMVVEVIPPKNEASPPHPQVVLPTIGEPSRKIPERESSVEEVIISLESPSQVTGIRLTYGRIPQSPVTRVELLLPARPGDSADDDDGWEEAWISPPDWPALTELILGLLEHPAQGSQTLSFQVPESFQTFTTDTVKLRLTGYQGPPDVAAIEILGADDPS